MSPLRCIRQAIREEHYRISAHANDEMAEDDLEIADIEHIVLTGKMFKKLTQDTRGIRYMIVGETTNRCRGYVDCRFLDSGIPLIITAYI
jgi:hypothetical protein